MATLGELVSMAIPEGIATVVHGGAGADATCIDTVTHDSRAVAPGTLFACLPGDRHDGHDFADAAVAQGAVALLVDHRLAGTAGSVPQVVVDDTRRRLGPIAALVAGDPSADLITVGVTGTNGKTTTVAMLGSILEANGWPTGIVGTLQGLRTTPEAPELQDTLRRFRDENRRAAVLEVSSHALALHRVDGTRFDVAVFTNLGRDHLDLHGTPEEYFRAKARLFDRAFTPLAVLNADDAHGRLLADTLGGDPDLPRVVTYSLDDAVDLEVDERRHRYRWRGAQLEVPLGGEYNVYNSLAAATTAAELGVPADTIAAGLAAMWPVPGRFELVETDPPAPFSVIVDYAHTPDGLSEVLRAARRTASAGRSVIAVFGCGGERDQDKRPEMGAIAAAAADRVFVTSDNPRTEDPVAILDDIVAGVPERYRSRVTSNPDRRQAIADAIATARPGDIIVVAGKGHETSQDLGDRTVEFDDRAVARSILEDHT